MVAKRSPKPQEWVRFLQGVPVQKGTTLITISCTVGDAADPLDKFTKNHVYCHLGGGNVTDDTGRWASKCDCLCHVTLRMQMIESHVRMAEWE